MNELRKDASRSRFEDRDHPPAPRYADRPKWQMPKPDERENYGEYSGDQLRR
ncbi:hypothetical protein GCM10027403_14890 [Arthrobacter tecti]